MNKLIKISAIVLVLLSLCVFTTLAISQSSLANSNAYSTAIGVATLSQGSKGNDVKSVQQKLKNWGYYTGAVDGIYGAQTKKAVIYFQQKNGLTADGIVGNATYNALGLGSLASSNNTSSNSTYTSSDLNLLAKCISAEARGESYTGQVAVGAVILNRVKSSSFPNTVSGVIYQKGAFSSVDDGQINQSATSSALNAAKSAMNGWDPTYGALYFYNPAKSTSSWIFSRKTLTTIGSHVFAI